MSVGKEVSRKRSKQEKKSLGKYVFGKIYQWEKLSQENKSWEKMSIGKYSNQRKKSDT